jgi:hypothetical protein
MELPFAGLHQLCAPLLDRMDRLPDPQSNALQTAFGLTTGEPPDRFLVGLAVLSVLAGVAEDRALICVIDDAQWLDLVSAQTLGSFGLQTPPPSRHSAMTVPMSSSDAAATKLSTTAIRTGDPTGLPPQRREAGRRRRSVSRGLYGGRQRGRFAARPPSGRVIAV